ncbi:hypothetical protein GCM10023107_66920 [Actinoplanes octamycinicus]
MAIPMVPRSGCSTVVSAALEQPVTEASTIVATTNHRMGAHLLLALFGRTGQEMRPMREFSGRLGARRPELSGRAGSR